MPSQSHAIDKIKLIEVLSTMIRAVEEDALKAGKISFNLTATGIYNVSVFYMEKNGK